MSNKNDEPTTSTIAETENFIAWKAEEPDGEVTYHIELSSVTVDSANKVSERLTCLP
jgi:hypothetical protein